jgi:3'(2'), 5'-bisphosphate nucleotidase
MVSQSIMAGVAAGREMSVPDADSLVPGLLAAALAGARALAEADRSHVVVKADGTPQTEADLMSDRAIRMALLREFPGMPIVSEESRDALPPEGADHAFVLVDPLDGTREYLEGHPDHAVCVALIVGRRPVAAAIVAPAMRKAWTAGADAREWALSPSLETSGEGRVVRASRRKTVGHIVTSRSRPDPFAAALRPSVPKAQVRAVGAVLKLVAVATGDACLFPAGNPSSEWDIAAGEALVLAAGGCMLGRGGEPLTYGHAERAFLHPPYAAGASERIVRDALAQWPAN